MLSIGQLSRRAGVKVPTIRYYEEAGLMPAPDRTAGNQRRYDDHGLERLRFIRHARELGFSMEAIRSLIALQDHPDQSCREAGDIAQAQLAGVRAKLRQLQALEAELARIADGCSGDGVAGTCAVLSALSDHAQCAGDHG